MPNTSLAARKVDHTQSFPQQAVVRGAIQSQRLHATQKKRVTEAPQQEQPNAAKAPNAEQHSAARSTVANKPIVKELNTWRATSRQEQPSAASAATIAMPSSSPPAEQGFREGAAES